MKIQMTKKKRKQNTSKPRSASRKSNAEFSDFGLKLRKALEQKEKTNPETKERPQESPSNRKRIVVFQKTSTQNAVNREKKAKPKVKVRQKAEKPIAPNVGFKINESAEKTDRLSVLNTQSLSTIS